MFVAVFWFLTNAMAEETGRRMNNNDYTNSMISTCTLLLPLFYVFRRTTCNERIFICSFDRTTGNDRLYFRSARAYLCYIGTEPFQKQNWKQVEKIPATSPVKTTNDSGWNPDIWLAGWLVDWLTTCLEFGRIHSHACSRDVSTKCRSDKGLYTKRRKTEKRSFARCLFESQ